MDEDKPVLIDKYLVGKEVEIDAICDGEQVFLPGIMELVERTGVHSGDSISVDPPFSISEKVKNTIADYTTTLGLGIGISGLFNIQFIVDKEDMFMLSRLTPERPGACRSFRNPRMQPGYDRHEGYAGRKSCRTGHYGDGAADKDRWYVKAPAFSFPETRRHGCLSFSGMKSTGEAIGYDRQLNQALYKALQASGIKMKDYGTVMVTLADEDKEEALPLVRRFYRLGFNIEATAGTANFLKNTASAPGSGEAFTKAATEILDRSVPVMSAISSTPEPSCPVSIMKTALRSAGVRYRTALRSLPRLIPSRSFSMFWRKQFRRSPRSTVSMMPFLRGRRR